MRKIYLNKICHISFFILMFCGISLLINYGVGVNCFAANFPLQITNIKPAGTGTPAIPSTHRIFRAYPGIEYNIRAAVTGGIYPYTFSLSNAPAGMTINASTGEISWPNPQVNSGTITLSVTDFENTTVKTTWAITVSTNGFRFVDSKQQINGTGTLTSPFNSLINMQSGTSTHSDIIYFRSGTYNLVNQYLLDGTNPVMLFESEPYTWLGYPNETVNIQGPSGARFTEMYLDNLNFINFTFNALAAYGTRHYTTIRRCKFSNLNSTYTATNPNVNQGYIFTTGATGSPQGYYLVIQDSEFNDFTSGDAIGSLYYGSYAVIEDNYIHDGGYINPGSNINATGISLKMSYDHATIRSNKIIMPQNMPIDLYRRHSNIEIDHNLIVALQKGAIRPPALNFFYNNNVFIHHNTIIGDIAHLAFTSTDCTGAGSACGPYNYYNNIIINQNSDGSYKGWGWKSFDFIGIPSSSTSISDRSKLGITDTKNLKSTATTGILDQNYNLIDRSLVGIYGWERGTATFMKSPAGLTVTPIK